MKRGDVYSANLNPVRGSEQSGLRPVLILQRDSISRYARTVIIVPFTSSQVEKYRQLPSCVFVPQGVAGLYHDSVLLGHQVRTIDRTRLSDPLGSLPEPYLSQVERALAFALQIPHAVPV